MGLLFECGDAVEGTLRGTRKNRMGGWMKMNRRVGMRRVVKRSWRSGSTGATTV